MTKARTPRRLADLTPDPQNRRTHTTRNLEMISAALRSVGASRSIVIDENDVILAGNGVTEAAAAAGLTKLQVVEADGDTIIAVRRRGLSATQKRDLAMFDNRTGELAEWNAEQLQADQDAGLTLEAWFQGDELARIGVKPDAKAGLTDPDAVPDLRATDIRRGDLFHLGAHRLLCGDSTQPADVARLMGEVRADVLACDPPYGVAFQGAGKKRWALFQNDSTNPDTYGPFVGAALAAFTPHCIDRASLYLWFSDSQTEAIVEAMHRAAWRRRAWIIWAKDQFVFSRFPQHHRRYRQQHEPCMFASRGATQIQWYGPPNESTLWRFDRPKPIENDDHPTIKPTALYERLLANSTPPGGVVAEGFGGSGSTLLAAERLGRRCLAMELEPGYCQVIVDRWEQFTGAKAEKVGEAVPA